MSSPGERLKQAREAAGHRTAADGARALGVPYATYAGHENGSREFDHETAVRYGRRFKVAPEWLLWGAAGAPARRSNGFSECEVSAWRRPARRGENLPAFDPASIAPGAVHPAGYMVRHSDALPFGIAAGSLIVIDLKARPADRQLVVARRADPETGEATTMLARLMNSALIGPRFPGDPADAIALDDNVSLVGPVVATLHAPELVEKP